MLQEVRYMYKLIDGKVISKQIKDELKEKVAAIKAEGTEICLAVIQVGNDPASSVYVGNKKKACEYIGIGSLSYELPENTTEEELLTLIEKLNADDKVNGILVQLPLPKHIDEDKVIKTISPKKDVDGFHPMSVGALSIGQPGIRVMYTGRCYPAHQEIRNRDRGQGVRCPWKKQHSRKAYGRASAPRERYSDRMPF